MGAAHLAIPDRHCGHNTALNEHRKRPALPVSLAARTQQSNQPDLNLR